MRFYREPQADPAPLSDCHTNDLTNGAVHPVTTYLDSGETGISGHTNRLDGTVTVSSSGGETCWANDLVNCPLNIVTIYLVVVVTSTNNLVSGSASAGSIYLAVERTRDQRSYQWSCPRNRDLSGHPRNLDRRLAVILIDAVATAAGKKGTR